MRRYSPASVVVFAIVISALVGGLFGKNALAVDDKIPDHYKTFTAALSAIEANYVEKVESDNVVYSAIRGMLSTLDPHSSFFSPVEYARMRERQEGRYYGIGIQIVSVDGDVTATRIFEGSPAYKAGVRRGDIISRIAGDDAKGWTNDQAMQKLRGPKGTNVGIEIKRDLVDASVARSNEANVKDLATFREGDLFTTDFGEATVVTAYLFPTLLERLIPKFEQLKPGTRIVTHQFAIPGRFPEKTLTIESKETGDRHSIYVWTIPFKK
jgi:membrane-associated protease RseP (regulator of RpoE activity)